MSKNSKLPKYEVVNTKKDKKLIGEVFDFKKIKTKGGPTTKPRANAPAWFIDFRNEVMQKFDRQDKRFDKLEKDVSNLNNRFDNLVEVNNLKD